MGNYLGNDFYCDQVLSGKTPVDIMLETSGVLAFKHTRPSWRTHVVVIPKHHVPSLVDLGPGGDKTLGDLMSVVQQVAEQVLEMHGACRVITNLGEYQESKHLHFHVIGGERLR